ncbi:hypothetical protein [Brevibacillus agri]|uniref:hypothetical protein n=1 Tax=Brevibacillus agri TaxID=51101 RepID=UPI001EE5C4A8|nr:hypothetical protein [Brevibacillus agri]MCG5252584.1 hypothetical protein [Brevibacillus agri]
MAQERKLTLALYVNSARELPENALYVRAFVETLEETAGAYDVDVRVEVNTAGDQQEPDKQPIGFAQPAVGIPVEYEDDNDGEGADGLRIQ